MNSWLIAAALLLIGGRIVANAATLDDEVAVYNALVTEGALSARTKVLAIGSLPVDPIPDAVAEHKEIRREFPSVDESAVRDFNAKRRVTAPLIQGLASVSGWLLVDKQVLARFGKDAHKYWQRFYRKFPGSAGQVYPSRVGFNVRGDQALVYLFKGYGELGADGGWYFLEKRNGRWKLRKRYLNLFSLSSPLDSRECRTEQC